MSVAVVSDTGVVDVLVLAESVADKDPSIGVGWQSCDAPGIACRALVVTLCIESVTSASVDGGKDGLPILAD